MVYHLIEMFSPLFGEKFKKWVNMVLLFVVLQNDLLRTFGLILMDKSMTVISPVCDWEKYS